MNQLVLQRARKLYELSELLLMEDESDQIQGEAYRYAYLILRGPKSFKLAFEEGILHLDKDKVKEAFWCWRLEIPGPKGISNEEIEIVQFHNKMVQSLISIKI